MFRVKALVYNETQDVVVQELSAPHNRAAIPWNVFQNQVYIMVWYLVKQDICNILLKGAIPVPVHIRNRSLSIFQVK